MREGFETEVLLDEHAVELSREALYSGKEKRQDLTFRLTLEEREFLVKRYRDRKRNLFSYLQ